MSTNVKIYQGSQIGGCVTVITYTPEISDNPALREPETQAPRAIRLMIDYGLSLPGSDITEGFKYDWEHEPVDGVFFTHYHGDHIGRFAEIPSGIKLYMGAVTRKVLINIYTYLEKSRDSDTKNRAKKALSILRDNDRIVEVTMKHPIVLPLPGENGRTDKQGAVTVTGYTIDHSAYDAFMYLVETPEQTILHTGDFRGHGYRGGKIIPMINKYIRRSGIKDVDIQIGRAHV